MRWPCVLGGHSPEEVVDERLRQEQDLANAGYRPPPDPCALPKAMLVLERAKDVSQPDTITVSEQPWREADLLPGEETRPERPPRPADAPALEKDHRRWLEGLLRSENRALSARRTSPGACPC
jgi:hypothetical protein